MAEYINIQAAIEGGDWYEHEFSECEYAIRHVADDIKKLPSADVEPVVRCKDCEFYTKEERWCRRLGLCGAFDTNCYCSHAERRKNGRL